MNKPKEKNLYRNKGHPHKPMKGKGAYSRKPKNNRPKQDDRYDQ